jgi:hypothetical protein
MRNAIEVITYPDQVWIWLARKLEDGRGRLDMLVGYSHALGLPGPPSAGSPAVDCVPVRLRIPESNLRVLRKNGSVVAPESFTADGDVLGVLGGFYDLGPGGHLLAPLLDCESNMSYDLSIVNTSYEK